MKKALAIASVVSLTGCAVAPPEAEATHLTGTHGAIEFDLHSVGSVAEGTNDFELVLTDAENKGPVGGASAALRTLMPAMGHMSDGATIVETSPGTYSVRGVVFDMPGQWALRFAVTKGTTADEAQFALDVP